MTTTGKNCLLVNNSILQTGAPTPNGPHVTTSIVLRLVNVCIAFIALIVSGSADTSFPLFACIGWVYLFNHINSFTKEGGISWLMNQLPRKES